MRPSTPALRNPLGSSRRAGPDIAFVDWTCAPGLVIIASFSYIHACMYYVPTQGNFIEPTPMPSSPDVILPGRPELGRVARLPSRAWRMVLAMTAATVAACSPSGQAGGGGFPPTAVTVQPAQSVTVPVRFE